MTKFNTNENSALGELYGEHLKIMAARHDHALEQTDAEHIVVFSGAPRSAFLDDYQMPFKPNPHFVSWIPLTSVPSSYIVYSPGETPLLIYYQPHDYWHVVPAAPEGYWTEQFDIRIVHTLTDIGDHLPEKRDNCILIGDIHEPDSTFGIERINPAKTVNILHFARGVKTDYELAIMRLVSKRGVTGHAAAATAFREGYSEFDIHRAYCEAVSHTESELPYGNIVALNEHGSVLHYTDLDRNAPTEMRSFLIDAGAQVHGYASDITRTYAYDDQRFQALIDRMEAMQLDIVAEVTAGVDYRELHISTHRKLAGILVDARLATGDTDTLLETGVTSAFFPHGLGHLLGIQVHDVGGFMEDESGTTIAAPSGHPFLRLTRILKEDMVLTIEPGLYVVDMLLENLRGTPAASHISWESVDWLRPFGGIRIEDNVRVLASGQENLTRDAFAQL